MRPTVHDIAARAGVSLATVDRVLNDRPGVRSNTVEKVEEAVRVLGYVRDVNAANLARQRLYPMTFILPAGPNSFMRGLEAEIHAAAGRSMLDRTTIKIVTVPAFDPGAISAALDAIDPAKTAGVALVAFESPDVIASVDRLAAEGVVVVTLVSDLPGSRRIHFCGIDNVAAGRTAAGLVGRFSGGRLSESQSGKVLVVAGSLRLSDHLGRASGFAEIMAREFPHLDLIGPLEGRDNPDMVAKAVSVALEAHPDIVAIYSLGAGNRGLFDVLAGQKGRKISTVVHELTEPSQKALSQGLIDAIINQDSGHEVRSAIRLIKAHADGLPPVPEQERIRIDIFLRDNLPQEPDAGQAR